MDLWRLGDLDPVGPPSTMMTKNVIKYFYLCPNPKVDYICNPNTNSYLKCNPNIDLNSNLNLL